MNGEFKQPFRKYIFCLFFILSGSFIAIRFALWGIEEIQSKHISSSVFCFTVAILGLLFGFLSIFVFQFNRNAFLKIENNKIDAQFCWGEELHAELKDITNAETQGKHLKLFIGNHVIWIYNLCNAKDLCEYILSHIARYAIPLNIEDAKQRYQKSKKSYIVYLVATVIAIVFMFVNVGWCVYLTEGKDLIDFSKSEDIVFLAFAFAEICTAILAFLLASKCGKKLEVLNMSKLNILSASAIEHKNDDLDKYPNVITKNILITVLTVLLFFLPKKIFLPICLKGLILRLFLGCFAMNQPKDLKYCPNYMMIWRIHSKM